MLVVLVKQAWDEESRTIFNECPGIRWDSWLLSMRFCWDLFTGHGMFEMRVFLQFMVTFYVQTICTSRVVNSWTCRISSLRFSATLFLDTPKLPNERSDLEAQLSPRCYDDSHPWKLIWNLKITQLKRKIIFWTSFLGSMMIFQGVNYCNF